MRSFSQQLFARARTAFLYLVSCVYVILFFFNDTASADIYTLSLHDALFFFLKDPATPEISPLPLHDPLPIPRTRSAPARQMGEKATGMHAPPPKMGMPVGLSSIPVSAPAGAAGRPAPWRGAAR